MLAQQQQYQQQQALWQGHLAQSQAPDQHEHAVLGGMPGSGVPHNFAQQHMQAPSNGHEHTHGLFPSAAMYNSAPGTPTPQTPLMGQPQQQQVAPSHLQGGEQTMAMGSAAASTSTAGAVEQAQAGGKKKKRNKKVSPSTSSEGASSSSSGERKSASSRSKRKSKAAQK